MTDFVPRPVSLPSPVSVEQIQDRGKHNVCINIFPQTEQSALFPSPDLERENETFALLVQKEKLFEDNSVSRAEAWSENDFSFKYVICAQHCNGLFTVHYSLFTPF